MTAHCTGCGRPMAPPNKVVVDLDENRILIGDNSIKVRAGVAEFCHILVSTGARTASKEFITARMWGMTEPACAEKSIHVVVCQLRHKLRPYGYDVQNVWSRGYKLIPLAKPVEN